MTSVHPSNIPFTGVEPRRAHDSDAGYDLFSVKHVTIQPGEQAFIDTGTAFALPEHTAGLVLGRSGIAKRGVHAHVGLCDSGYRGEVRVILVNHSDTPFEILAGERIAQYVILPVLTPLLDRVEVLPAGERADAGFGSTGR